MKSGGRKCCQVTRRAWGEEGEAEQQHGEDHQAPHRHCHPLPGCRVPHGNAICFAQKHLTLCIFWYFDPLQKGLKGSYEFWRLGAEFWLKNIQWWMFISGNAFLRKRLEVFGGMDHTLLPSQYGAHRAEWRKFLALLSCYSIEIAWIGLLLTAFPHDKWSINHRVWHSSKARN